MSKRSTVLAGGLFLVASLALAACGPKKASINASLADFSFAPNTWTVPAGAEVTLTLTNTAADEHEWVLMDQGYQVTPPFDDDDEPHVIWEAEVEGGQTQTFVFTAPTTAGDYPIVCGLPGHYEGGMTGTLTVR
jgi:uncharacterized cupredoxin-like copper-binding protein